MDVVDHGSETIGSRKRAAGPFPDQQPDGLPLPAVEDGEGGAQHARSQISFECLWTAEDAALSFEHSLATSLIYSGGG